MPSLIIANQHPGPLPLKFTFKALSDGPATLNCQGSVWTSAANTMIGFSIELDGKQIGSAMIFSNQAGTHRAVVPASMPVQLPFGSHTITLTPANGATTSDFNDLYTVVLDY